MNVLITGATGKIGKIILNELLTEKQFKIFALLRKNDKSDVNLKTKVLRGDLTDLSSLRKAVKDVGTVDTVLHLAAVTHTNSKPEYYQINLDGTKNLIKISEEIKVKRIIFISSRAACIGGGDYAESKLAAEVEIKKSKLSWLILALGEVYSINGDDEINRLYKFIKNHFFIPIIGKGEYKLAPVYIDDVVRAIGNAIKRKKLIGKRYIICGSENYSYKEFVTMLIDFIAVKKQIVYIPLFFLRLFFWLVSFLKVKIVAYDQLDRLIVKKPSDISQSIGDLDFNPRKISEVLKLF